MRVYVIMAVVLAGYFLTKIIVLYHPLIFTLIIREVLKCRESMQLQEHVLYLVTVVIVIVP